MEGNTRAKHPLRGLLLAQFLGAFNDNALKVFVALMAMKNLALTPGTVAFAAASQVEATKAFVALTLPLMLVSLPAAMVADRFSKRTVIVGMKFLEIFLMGAVGYSLYRYPEDANLPFIILACMGAQSALFSPAKMGILPEVLPEERLSVGNGLLQMWTMLAIIIGTAAAGPFSDLFGATRPWIVGSILAVLALIGFVASLTVPRVPAARFKSDKGGTFRGAGKAIREDRTLRLVIMGAAYLWGIASLLGQNILVYAKATLELSDTLSSLPLAVLGIGIAIGSVLAGKLSAGKVELGLIPAGAVGMALVTLAMAIWAPHIVGTLIVMILLGVSGGLIIVPIHALIQWHAPSERRGAVIALANILISAAILAGSLGAFGLAVAGVSPRGIMLVAGLVVAAGTYWSLHLLPEAFLRLGFVLVSHTVYKLRVVHPERVPHDGPALLLPNHVSFIDGLIMLASSDRPIRFVIDARYYNMRLLKPFLTLLRAIPMPLGAGPKPLLRALRDAGKLLDEGEVVCIFPEGQITRTGMLGSFQRGFQRIVGDRDVPIIPVAIDRVWGSIFSRSGGRFVTKMPRQVPYPITVAFGEPLPAGMEIHKARAAVRELATEAWKLRKPDSRPLYARFIRTARRRPWYFSMADASRPKVSRFATVVGSIALGRVLKSHWEGQQRVGILLPPSIGGALVNFAAAIAGRTSVNLNYTSGKLGLESACEQAELKTVVTSRRFITNANLELPENIQPIWIEDLETEINGRTKMVAALVALFGPLRTIEKVCGSIGRPSPDDVATIIFSSGSTGDPKGVQLTQFNLESNVEAAAQVIQCGPGDVMLGILPFFHSFGYMATLWLPAHNGLGVVYHTNPMDAGGVGALVQSYKATILIATPTLLQLYARRCEPRQFGSLRLVIGGAEKLPAALAQMFEDTFGLPAYEGYGATEASPGIALNLPGYRATGYYQPGSRRGTVGQPLPGVSVRIVGSDNGQLLEPGEPGMILVNGPNIMVGYLKRPDLTEKAMDGAWYVTGDIGMVDEDGFLTITDRLARFSKIGGEMVPHGVIEEKLHEAIVQEEKVFAVTSVPDNRRGERIVVLHTIDPEELPGVLERLQTMGLPNLFIPKKDDFIEVDKLPILGTGKTDLRVVKKTAMDAFKVQL